MEITKNNLIRTETELKLERRKTAGLTREMEQMQFTVETSQKDLDETSSSLKNQISKLTQENANLMNRVEKTLREGNRKLEEKREELMRTKSINKQLEETKEKLAVMNDNLMKKVEFFKKGTQKTNLLAMMENEKKMSTELQSLQKRYKSIKGIALTLAKHYKVIIESFRQDSLQIRQEISCSKKSLFSAIQMVIVKAKDETKKSIKYEEQILRLKTDLSYLENLNMNYNSGTERKAYTKLSSEEIKICQDTDESMDQSLMKIKDEINESERNTLTRRRENHFKRCSQVSEVQDSTSNMNFYLSVTPPEVNCSLISNAEVDKKEVKKLEEESIEIEKRILKLRRKSIAARSRAEELMVIADKENSDIKNQGLIRDSGIRTSCYDSRSNYTSRIQESAVMMVDQKSGYKVPPLGPYMSNQKRKSKPGMVKGQRDSAKRSAEEYHGGSHPSVKGYTSAFKSEQSTQAHSPF